ncbi:hypothetical protein [Aurantibacter sp.]|uniref:hypothetical protein n=1 Tax=Aurantibacter sp. TaxID=2807103 RepID=UPI0035C7A193
MKFLQKYKAYLLVVYAFLILLHFIIKDNYYPLSILFYASPLILIISYGWFTSYAYYKTKLLPLIVICQIIITTLWFVNNYYINNIRYHESNATVFFWNLAKKKTFPLKTVTSRIESKTPELLAFVEDKSINNFNSKPLKNYSYKKLADNMSILYLGELLDIQFYYKEENYKFNVVKIKYKNNITSYLIADVWASPFVDKKEALTTISDYATNNNIDIILGDFNTPYESIHFKKFYREFNSFHSKNNGLTATWYYGFPLLELDQIWLNKKHQPLLLEKSQHLNSDHKLLIATYLKH